MRKFLLICCVMLLAACATQQKTSNDGSATDNSGSTRPEADLPTQSGGARDKSRIHVELGNAYLEGARMGVALEEAKTAINYDRTYAPAQLLLGQIYANLEQYDLADPAFVEASRLAPGDPEINNSYGWYLCSRGREQEGLVRIQEAARNPYFQTPARAYANAGLCYLHKKDDKSAEAEFAHAYQYDPSNKPVLYQLAAIAFRSGNYARASALLSTLQGLMPAPTPETLWLGLRIEHKLGNKDKETDYAFRLRRDFASSEEYQALLQGKYE